MIWLVGLLIIGLVCFSAVLLVGAPYLPTLKPAVVAALELADLKPGQRLIELGCGDGRVLIAAAKKGFNVVGYELNPLLASLAWLRTRRYADKVVIIWGDFWKKPWPEAEAIFVFLLPKYMTRLNNKCVRYTHKPLKLLSFVFEIPGLKVVDKRSGVNLYLYK